MAVIGFEITKREPYEGGQSFGDTGPYERIDGIARYAVDPASAANDPIVDLALAGRGPDGLVHFDGDVTILRPLEPGRSGRVGLVEVPNRGRRTLFGLHNRAAPMLEPTEAIDPGDGFLLRHGWTVAWCGWQWDVPRSPARMGLTAPVVLGPDGDPLADEIQLRLQLGQRVPSVDLTDHHVGLLGGHEPLPTADVDDPGARLLVRDGIWGEPTEIPRDRWRFARHTDDGQVVADERHVWLEGSFEPGRIYDLIYRTRPVRIAGAGLLAVRDLGTFLRSDDEANPCAGELDHLHVTGQSQCGRFLRTLCHLGLNRGEDGRRAYDGALIHIAGGRRGEFNHRGAQPSVQPTPSFGHLFPFADEAQSDPRSGRTDGLLDWPHQPDRDLSLPLIIYTNTASEYWRGDASLAHTSVVDGADIDPPATTRHYLFASTQHGPGMLPLMDESLFGTSGGNCFNIVDYTPLMRAAVTNLRHWVADGTEPPPNAVPRLDTGTATTRADALDTLTELIEAALPEAERLPTLYPLDLGPDAERGIGRYPASRCGEAYPCVVSALDDDGNEVAGIRMPDVSVPVATHLGFNPRSARSGAPEEILDYIGSTVPFAATPADRAAGDRRPSLAERYRDEDDYRTQVRAAAEELVAAGYLLAEDVAVCERIALRRYASLGGPDAG
jgi:hypothetical protein